MNRAEKVQELYTVAGSRLNITEGLRSLFNPEAGQLRIKSEEDCLVVAHVPFNPLARSVAITIGRDGELKGPPNLPGAWVRNCLCGQYVPADGERETGRIVSLISGLIDREHSRRCSEPAPAVAGPMPVPGQ